VDYSSYSTLYHAHTQVHHGENRETTRHLNPQRIRFKNRVQPNVCAEWPVGTGPTKNSMKDGITSSWMYYSRRILNRSTPLAHLLLDMERSAGASVLGVHADNVITKMADQQPVKKQRIVRAIHEVDSDGSDFICKANDILNINFITNEESVQEHGDAAVGFRPEYTHQFFGEQETIIGFKNLKIDILFSPSGRHCFFRSTFDDRLVAIGVNPEDEMPEKKLNGAYGLPPGYTKSYAQFMECLNDELQGNVVPPGTLVQTYEGKHNDVFELYRSAPAENPEAKQQHERHETLAFYTIDGASPVDLDDHRWFVYTIYQKVPVAVDSTKCFRKFVGYVTAFQFNNPFRGTRTQALRVCQLLVCPHFQRQGHGSKLLRQVADDIEAKDMFELTMEDPSDVLTGMRNVMDIRNCLRQMFFIFQGSPRIAPEASTANILPLSWRITEEYIDNVHHALRITRKQIQLCYEVLKLEAVLASGSEKDSFKAEVQQRLYVLHKPDLDEIKNSEGVKNFAEMKVALNSIYDGQEAYFKDLISALG
jgi:histone acetyltransferase 1